VQFGFIQTYVKNTGSTIGVSLYEFPGAVGWALAGAEAADMIFLIYLIPQKSADRPPL
jgi:hypothetical protein